MSEPTEAGRRARPFPRWLMPASVVALVLAAVIGVAGDAAGWAWVPALADLLEPVGRLWMQALRYAVVPLVATQLVSAVLEMPQGGRFGGMTLKAVALILGLLALYSLVMVVVAPLLVQLYTPPPGVGEAIRASVGTEGAPSGPAADPTWVDQLLAVLNGRQILPTLLASVILGFALARLPEGPRGRVRRVARRLSDGMLRLVGWILLLTPAAVFLIVLRTSLGAGFGAVELALVYVVVLSLLFVLGTVALYPLAAVLARRPVRELVRGFATPQLVAVSTQSSVASLPAMIEAAEGELDIPPAVAGLVLPLTVAIFKLSQTILEVFRLFLLAKVFGVALTPVAVLSFVVAILLISFGTVGLPRGGGAMRGLPVFVAAGIPIEGYLLTEAVETVPDIFATVINVTGDMTVATVVAGPPVTAVAPSAHEPLVDVAP